MSFSLFPFLVVDVGGTNARFGIVTGIDKSPHRFIIEDQCVLQCCDFSSIEMALDKYLEELTFLKPTSACIAVAGPVICDQIKMTNLSWEFSIDSMKKRFGFSALEVMNDFGAQAFASLVAPPQEIKTISSGFNKASTRRVVIGPGTGLGVAGLVQIDGVWHPLCGEGGHVNFAPRNLQEIELLKVLKIFHARVSVEHLISGPGLVNIYKALAVLNDVAVEQLTPKEISSSALNASSPLCVETLSLFLSILGSFSGDMVLAMGSFGGVYFGGGILPKVESLIADSDLVSSFRDKGSMQELIGSVPIYLIKGTSPTLDGAAYRFYSLYCNVSR